MNKLRIIRYIGCGFHTFQSAITKCLLLDTLTADKGLSKSLPENFGDLINLKQLKLCNGLLDILPNSFSNLINLTDLSLRYNSLSIFPEVLLKLSQLEQLDIAGNSFVQVPSNLFILKSLKSLDLSDNRIEHLPSTIGTFARLQHLDVSLNRLSNIPEEIANLNELEYLDISFNDLKILPRNLKKMKSLKYLNLYGNQLNISEIDTLRHFLPDCRIIGDRQNTFQLHTDNQVMDYYNNNNYGVSFFYPPQFRLDARVEGKDSLDLVIDLSRKVTYDQEIDGVVYHFTNDAVLNIKVSKDEFDNAAYDAGFSKNEMDDDTMDSEIKGNNQSSLWVSLGRQGMQEDVSVISADGWRGFYGNNSTGTFGESDNGGGSGYQGLHEFFIEFARKKIRNGKSISLFYNNDIDDDDDIFHTVLSSIKNQSSTYKTSFDCNKASSPVEYALCQNENLAKADLELNANYKELLLLLSIEEKQVLKKEQRDWIKERDEACNGQKQILECLNDKYYMRNTLLKTKLSAKKKSE